MGIFPIEFWACPTVFKEAYLFENESVSADSISLCFAKYDQGRLRTTHSMEYSPSLCIRGSAMVCPSEHSFTYKISASGQRPAYQVSQPQRCGWLIRFGQKKVPMPPIPARREFRFFLVQIAMRHEQKQVAPGFQHAPPVLQRHHRVYHVLQRVGRSIRSRRFPALTP